MRNRFKVQHDMAACETLMSGFSPRFSSIKIRICGYVYILFVLLNSCDPSWSRVK